MRQIEKNYSIHKTPGRRTLCFLLTFLAAILFIAVPYTAYADPATDELRENLEQQAQIFDQISQNQAAVDRLMTESVSLQAKFDALQPQIEQQQAKVAELDAQLLLINSELQQCEDDIDKEYETYYAQVRRAEEYGTSAYWSMLLKTSNMTELMNCLDYISESLTYQETIIERLQTMAAEIKTQHKALMKVRSERNYAYVQLRATQTELHNAIESRILEIQALESATEAQAAELTALQSREKKLSLQIATGFSADDVVENYTDPLSDPSLARGIDTSTPLLWDEATALKAAGYEFVGRYLVPTDKYRKALTRSEAQMLSAAGLKILSVYETTASRAGEGANAGAKDGKIAYELAKDIGMPQGSAIYFAVDFDAREDDYGAVFAYLRAAKEQLNGEYRLGVYGGYFLCRDLMAVNLCDAYWQTYAWSTYHGKIEGAENQKQKLRLVSKDAQVFQATSTTQIGLPGRNVGVDINTCPNMVAAGLWTTL